MLLTIAPGFKPLILAVGQGRSSSKLGPILGPLDVQGSSHQPQSLSGKQRRLKGAGGGINSAKRLSMSLADAEQTVSIKSSRYCTWTGPTGVVGAGSALGREPKPVRERERSRGRRRCSGC